MSSRFEQARQEEARTARLAAQTEALKRWLEKKHPEIRFSVALLKEFQENMVGAFFTADDADWEFALSMIDTRYLRQHVPSPQETKSEVIEEILSLLSAHSRRDEFMLKSEESRMKHMSVDALQARLAELKFKVGAVSTPVSNLKAFVADSRADTRKYLGFPDLDKSVDAAHIKNLSTFELKKLIRVYSVQQVNDRLSGRN